MGYEKFVSKLLAEDQSAPQIASNDSAAIFKPSQLHKM